MALTALNRLPAVAARGVYCLPWIGKDGEIFLAAVDRLGQRILEATVYPGEEVRCIEKELLRMLDEQDPKPTLRILP